MRWVAAKTDTCDQLSSCPDLLLLLLLLLLPAAEPRLKLPQV